MGELLVKKYSEDFESEWDEFVLNTAINGTFLQTRRFLNYHFTGKFIDASWMIINDKGKIIAVCPGNEVIESGKKILCSHTGSTYGGIIISLEYCKIEKLIDIIKMFEDMWIQNGYHKVILKQTPRILSCSCIDVFRYCYYYLGYNNYEQPNLYIDLEKYNENILSNFSQGKRTNVNNCVKSGFYYKKIGTLEEIENMYKLLALSLEKYDIKPIHNVAEIYDLLNNRIEKECECFAIYDKKTMIAASMMFYFERAKVAHTQYLCADPSYNKLSPMTFMYYTMILEAKRKQYSKISWGICSENNGTYLNVGLAKSKEAFGSICDTNPVFIKVIE